MDKNKNEITGLTEEEEKELGQLDNPQIEFMGPSLSIFAGLIKDKFSSRKEKVVKLRMKKRMAELNINPQKDFSVYYTIMEEEEKRFDERFNKNR
jgi:hypothetical protein